MRLLSTIAVTLVLIAPLAEAVFQKKEAKSASKNLVSGNNAPVKSTVNSVSAQVKADRRAEHQKLVEEVNAKAQGWKAKVHDQFAEMDPAEFAAMQGDNGPKGNESQISGGKNAHTKEKTPKAQQPKGLAKVGEVDPATFMPLSGGGGARQKRDVTCLDYRFDVRQKWPSCSGIIGNIRDQSKCGCCWAVSTASAFSDRYCIQLVNAGWEPYDANSPFAYFSALDTIKCSGGCTDGVEACNGGYSSDAWKYFSTNGVVTGGNYSFGGCSPYPFPIGTVASANGVTSYSQACTCSSSCSNSGYWYSYADDKIKANDYNVLQGPGWEQAMQDAIYYNGSITVSMIAYDDLQTYAGGIYYHTTGVNRGGHAVRVIGYGHVDCSNGTTFPYWYVANSWNSGWGEQGFFRIRRGTNECGIEQRTISFGTPAV